MKVLVAIFIIGSVASFGAKASTYLESLQVDAESTDSPLLRQLIEHAINVRKADDEAFIKILQKYYGEHSTIDVDLGTVKVELLEKWHFINRDLPSRAKIIGLSYLISHPEDRDVTVYIGDFKGSAIERYITRSNYVGENAMRQTIDDLTRDAGLDHEPFNRAMND